MNPNRFLHYESYVGWWLLTEDANGNRFAPWCHPVLLTDEDAQRLRKEGVPIR